MISKGKLNWAFTVFVSVSIVIVLYQCLFVAFNSDGQAIAIKLSKQITKVTDNVKKTIACYNAIQSAAILTFDSVKDPSSDLYPNLQSSPTFLHAIPNSATRTAVELHCLKERCGEEISLLTIEMHRLHKQMTILAMAFNSEGTEEAAKVTLGLNNFVSFQTGWIWKAAILLEMSQGRTRSHYSWITWNCFVLPRVSGHQHAWSG